VHESPEEPELSIEELARVRVVDMPAPRLGDVECGAKPPRIPTGSACALPDVEDEARAGTLDLIGDVGAVSAQLRDDRTQRADEIESNGICGEVVHDWFPSGFLLLKRSSSALTGAASGLARTRPPREKSDERQR
jgi:hypothetical protein